MARKNASKHGSLGMYTNHKCRCDWCVSNWNAYWRMYEKKKKAERKALSQELEATTETQSLEDD